MYRSYGLSYMFIYFVIMLNVKIYSPLKKTINKFAKTI